ncbi:MAG TPA: penicillin-binding transpeptidase domain-containing protein [Actinocatenispora sp.]
MPTPRTPGPDPRRGRGADPDGVVVPLRRGGTTGREPGGLADAKRYRPRGRTVREAADPADASRRADRARSRQSEQPPEEPATPPRQPADRRGRGTAGRTASGTRRTDTAGDRGQRSGSSGRTASSGRTGDRGQRSVRGQQEARDRKRDRTAGSGKRKAAPRDRGSAGQQDRKRGAKPGRVRTALRSDGLRSKRASRKRPARRGPFRGGVVRLGSPGRRLRLGTVVVLVLFTVIAGRLVQLQVTDAHAYATRALNQRLWTVPLPAARGSILDRNGTVLAHSVEARYVFADPSMIADAAKVARQLSPVLGIARSTLEKDMRKQKLRNGTPLRFVYLARGVDIPVGDRVAALDIPGIGVKPDERRDDPGHDLAANIVGSTGYDLSGLTGLEAEYDPLLRGTDGVRKYEAGRDGVEIPDGYHEEKPARPGGSVQLTLDRDIQFEAQRALFAKLNHLNSDMGAAVVLDVKTGQVLAQASYPTYDAGDIGSSTKTERTDWASQAVVEPGSVHKAITIGAGLQTGVIKPDSAIPVKSTVTKGDTTYEDTHWHGNVKITVPGIFAYSSNVGTITVADKVGAQRLYEFQRKFGLGSPTGEGVPGEANGIVRPASTWQGADYGSIPIGLGVAVTPIQLAAAYGAIANDGEYVQPHLIDKTVGPDGKTTTPKVDRHRVLSPSVAAAERKAMVAVTTVPGATGLSGAVDGYQVAAKTGTGQRVVGGSYQKGNIESFIGMAPADHPRYVVAVFAHTSGSGEGANMGPVFQQIMRFALGHGKVPPSDAKPPTFRVYG